MIVRIVPIPKMTKVMASDRRRDNAERLLLIKSSEPIANRWHLESDRIARPMNLTAIAIIFDMDGVLIDSEPAHKLAKERAFARFGVTLPEAVYEQYKGSTDETVMNEIVPTIPGLSVDAGEMLRLKHQEFEALEHMALPIDGAREFVIWAKTKFRIALATSATPRNRQAALSVLGLSDSFDYIVDASGFSHPKPDPEVFLVALRGLQADPAQCIVIEDSLNGVVAGKAAGCRVVAITTSFAEGLLRSKGADQVVHNFQELRGLLRS